MRQKNKSIPVNTMVDEPGAGIAIEKIIFTKSHHTNQQIEAYLEEANQPHRHDRHSFFLLEKGSVSIEIDFQQFKIKSPAVIYIHPNQVHRTMDFKNVTVSSWSINNENLHPEYAELLENITPAKPLQLKPEIFSLIAETVALAIKFTKRKSDKLYHSLLKDGCNTLVSLVISQYLAQSKTIDHISRFETVTKAFKKKLEHNYATIKRPAAYAKMLHLSTPYLNECVKNTTGFSVSHHILQRAMLEAKRLLAHSNKTVKEIAAELGYDDYPYFSRLFTKLNGITALTFRNKNLD